MPTLMLKKPQPVQANTLWSVGPLRAWSTTNDPIKSGELPSTQRGTVNLHVIAWRRVGFRGYKETIQP